MNTESGACTCTEEGYSPYCPQAFVQGGKVLHVLDEQDQLKPRKYEKSDSHTIEKEEKLTPRFFIQKGKDERARALGLEDQGKDKDRELPKNDSYDKYLKFNTRKDSVSSSSLESAFEEVENCLDDSPSQAVVKQHKMGRGYLSYDYDMQENNRDPLPKFEALKINNQSINEVTIGGFPVDLRAAAEKVREIIPLPPVRLPVIFLDKDMNFFHHFFQGMDMLIGRDIIHEIVTSKKYYGSGELLLIPLLEKIIKAGYEKQDSEITIFVKRVLTSTFNLDAVREMRQDGSVLIVAANLWDFQYIESGMQCKEVDIKMWLSMCYNHYKTIWFNTFKSSGVPLFALDGVQTRYENGNRLLNESRNENPQLPREAMQAIKEATERMSRDLDNTSTKSRRRKHSSKPEPPSRGFFGRQ